MVAYYAPFLRKILFNKSWGRIFEGLSPEQVGYIVKALFCFVEGDEDPDLKIPKELRITFRMMAEEIEQSAETYCQKARLGDYE